MKYQELLILLPCHSLEDFPTYHEGDDADSLLASWTALWHPALLASAGCKPSWWRVDTPGAELAGRLLVVPTVSVSQLPTGFSQRARDEGACLVRKPLKREDVLQAALPLLDGGSPTVDPDLAADFMALGYGFLQVQLLTRQMRYSSNLDEVHFQNQVVAGARAALEGDVGLAREKLGSCFDMLAEERNHYYPVDAFLLDMNLIAPSTLGASLRQELASDTPKNVLLSGRLLDEMATREPASLEQLRDAVGRGTVGVVGGDSYEARFPLLGYETLLADLRAGGEMFERRLGVRPKVFGRRRFGLGPTLPQLLRKLGFVGAVHATLDDGRFPQGSQIKIRWEGCDGTSVEAVARPPLDAAKAQTFLSLAIKLGESMDSDHVATLCLAHWPGASSVWLDDLRRIARHCPALGKFASIEQYFTETAASAQLDRFEASQYRSPYLKQAVIRQQVDPISSVQRYWRRRAELEAAEALGTLADLIGARPTPDAAAAPALRELAAQIDRASELDAAAGEPPELDAQLTRAVQAAAERVAAALPRGKDVPRPGSLVLNPQNVVRRIGVHVDPINPPPAVEKPIYAAETAERSTQLVVDVPPLGFVWAPAASSPARSKKPAPKLAEENLLRTEFFEAIVNPVTGALQSLHEYEVRGNRLSQQLSFREPGSRGKPGDVYRDPDETAEYSVMAADSLDVTSSSSTFGELTVRGRLLDKKGGLLARFVEKFQVWRGSRILVVDLELDPQVEPQADPWNSYFAVRFAWADESAELFRTVNQTRQSVAAKQFEAPQYVEIVSEPKRTAILTGGLPFHRRAGGRMLDSLLIVRGERQRKFRFGIGLDLPHPQHDAWALVGPKPAVTQTASSPAPAASGWLFHLDNRHVQATHWAPVIEDGRSVGFRVRLLEASGRPGRVKISAFRDLRSARQLDFKGDPTADCAIENGAARVELGGHEWTEVEGRWA